MNKPELLDLILTAIDTACKEQQRSDIVLKLTAENSLAPLGKAAVLKILADFQRKDGIAVIRLSEANFPEQYRDREIVAFHTAGMRIPVTTPIKLSPPKDDEIYLKVYDGFNNWIASHRLRTCDDLDQITPLTLAKVCLTVLDISEKLEASGQPTMNIYARFQYSTPFFPKSFIPSEYRKDALDYMKNKGVVTAYKISYLSASGVDASMITLTIDIPKFQVFKARAGALYIAKERELASPPAPDESKLQPVAQGNATEILYEVKLTASREVLLNGIQLCRLDFGGENETVFGHLFKNPNRIIPVEELEKLAGDEGLKKGLSKIIENVGFTGDMRKAFFNISKTSIQFRNPLTRKDLEHLGMHYIKLPR